MLSRGGRGTHRHGGIVRGVLQLRVISIEAKTVLGRLRTPVAKERGKGHGLRMSLRAGSHLDEPLLVTEDD